MKSAYILNLYIKGNCSLRTTFSGYVECPLYTGLTAHAITCGLVWVLSCTDTSIFTPVIGGVRRRLPFFDLRNPITLWHLQTFLALLFSVLCCAVFFFVFFCFCLFVCLFFLLLSFVFVGFGFVCLSSSSVLRVQCYQCLWNVHSWFPLRYFITFNYFLAKHSVQFEKQHKRTHSGFLYISNGSIITAALMTCLKRFVPAVNASIFYHCVFALSLDIL